jgi:hypothetical protein
MLTRIVRPNIVRRFSTNQKIGSFTKGKIRDIRHVTFEDSYRQNPKGFLLGVGCMGVGLYYYNSIIFNRPNSYHCRR